MEHNVKSIGPTFDEPAIVPLVTQASHSPTSMLRRDPDNTRRPMNDAAPAGDVRAPGHYINRELSFLEFNERVVEPVLSPRALDPAHPFPRIQNKSLNFIVRLSGTDAFGRRGALVVLQAPRSLPRVIAVPGVSPPGAEAIYLSTIIQAFVAELFPGLKVEGCYQFRVTRNSDLLVEEEDAEDLLRAVKGEL